jgi:hypothetical protein
MTPMPMSAKQVKDLRDYIQELRRKGQREEARLLETLL